VTKLPADDPDHLRETEIALGVGQAAPVIAAQPEHADAAGVTDQPASAEPVRKTDRRWVTGALMLVMVLASMEMTVTSTAMPTIIGELHGLEHYSWVASIYLLACTVSMPLYGRLADVLGRKRVIMAAVAIFTVGSVLSAYSQSMTQLIVCRGVQGLGAGGIMPVVLTIIGDLFTLEERARIQGFFSAVWGTSSLAGPALGAFLVHTLGWRWVFLVNLPFGFLGLAVLAWKYHDRQKPHSTALDLPGIAAISFGSLALLALVSRLGPEGWGWPAIAGLTVFVAACFAFFLWQERRTANPVMPPSLMLRREIGPSILGTFFFGAVFLCLDTYVPLYVQGGLGGGASAAAAVVTPVMLTWAISGPITAPLLIRWGWRKTALVGCCLIVAGMTGLFVGALLEWPQGVLTAILAVTGFGFGPASMSYLLAAQDAVTWQQRGIVTSSVGFFRTIGGAMGIGLLGAAFNMLARNDLHKLQAMGVSPAAALDPHLQKDLSPQATELIQHAIKSGLLWVFAAMLVLAIVQFAATLLMRGKSPSHAVTRSEGFESSLAH
jgi:MFS family permease